MARYKKSILVDPSGKAFSLPIPKKRSYASAEINDLNRDWLMPATSGDSEIRTSLSTVRRRARETERNNPFYEHHLNLQVINLVGPPGIMPQMLLQKPDGSWDEERNNKIESAFRIWGRMENCSVDGLRSWIDLQKLLVRSLDRDGEILFLIFKGPQYGPFGYQLKPLEGDHLDEGYFSQLPNGNYIKMGIEFDPYGKPIAYHLLSRHPGDFYGSGNFERIRFEASRVIHVFDPSRRASQNRGISKGASALVTLHHQEAAEEATLIAYRAAACQSGFLEREMDAMGEVVGDAEDDSAGEVFFELEPGVYRKLPPGFKFVPHNPSFPTTEYQEFAKHLLRKSSAGLGSPYHSLSWDLEGVNFSSIRSGTLDFRDACSMMHKFIEEHFCERVFSDWLEMALLTKAIDLPFEQFEELNNPEFRYWQPRGWDWVDPQSDALANIIQSDAGLLSKTEIIAKRGGNIEDTWRALAREKDLRKTFGLSFGAQLQPLSPPQGDLNREEAMINRELEQMRSDQLREIKEHSEAASIMMRELRAELVSLRKEFRFISEELIFIRKNLTQLLEIFEEPEKATAAGGMKINPSASNFLKPIQEPILKGDGPAPEGME
jgi:lambda family phage portal protein